MFEFLSELLAGESNSNSNIPVLLLSVFITEMSGKKAGVDATGCFVHARTRAGFMYCGMVNSTVYCE